MKPVVVATGVIEGSAVTRCDPGIFAPGHAWSQTTEAAVQVRAGLTNTWWPFDDPYKWLKVPWPTRVATSVRLVTRADSAVTCLGGWRVYRTLGTVDVLGPQGASVSTNASIVTRTLCGRTS